jgi:imidazolonepropionase-like amidohydrolase
MDKQLHIRAVMIEDGCERDLVIADGRVIDASPAPGVTPDATGWVLPGLVDMHNHLSLASPAGDDPDPAIRVRASASVELALGVLAIREPGSPDDASAGLASEEGWPRVITAGRFLAPPGGYFPGLAREVSAAELPDAAVQEARRSRGWVKIIGDFLSGGRFVTNWPVGALREAVGRVHAEGGRVAIHAVGAEVVADAIAVGVDSIEHGQAVTDADFAVMRDRGIALVPTLNPALAEEAFEFALSVGASRETAAWMRESVRSQPATVARAHEHGVVVLAGTDAGQFPHGAIVDQIQFLADGGMPVNAAIGAGSWTARRYLGLSALEPETPADLVVYEEDPRADLSVLRRPALIVLGGHLVSQPVGAMRH